MIKIKKNTFIILAAAAIALLPFLAFASVDGTPQPNGQLTKDTNGNITVSLSLSDPELNSCQNLNTTPTGWAVVVDDFGSNSWSTGSVACDQTATFTQNLPVGNYNLAYYYCSTNNADCTQGNFVAAYSFSVAATNPLNGIFAAGMTTPLGQILETGFGYLLALLAGLISLGILIHYVRKWIGNKSGRTNTWVMGETESFKRRKVPFGHWRN